MPAPKGNQNAKGNSGGGRPTRYNKSTPAIVRGLRERGATEREIAEILGISDRTLRQWRALHVEFCAALNVSNEVMVKRARESLYHRAVGYSFQSEKVFQSQGKIVRAKTTEHVPPDVTAALKILERLDPATWKERAELKHVGSGENGELEFKDVSARDFIAGEIARIVARIPPPRDPGKDDGEAS